MQWPATYREGNTRRVVLLRRQSGGDTLTPDEENELQALEMMVEAWVESRWPTPAPEPLQRIVRSYPAVIGERFTRPEFTLDPD